MTYGQDMLHDIKELLCKTIELMYAEQLHAEMVSSIEREP